MENTPNILYKYVTPERTDILKNLKIRFTQPSALNDPFEFNLAFKELLTSKDMLRQLNIIGPKTLFHQSLLKLPTHQRVLIYSLPKEQLMAMEEKAIEKFFSLETIESIYNEYVKPNTQRIKSEIYSGLDKNIGVLSLTANCETPPMWASYADNSKGFVIGFDTKSDFFNRRRSDKDEFYHLRKVLYEDSQQANSINEMTQNFLIQKNKSWEYENEWRILLPLNTANTEITTDDDSKIFLFDIPASSISEIIFGLNTTQLTIDDVVETISNLTPNSHIKLSKAIKGATGFEIAPF